MCTHKYTPCNLNSFYRYVLECIPVLLYYIYVSTYDCTSMVYTNFNVKNTVTCVPKSDTIWMLAVLDEPAGKSEILKMQVIFVLKSGNLQGVGFYKWKIMFMMAGCNSWKDELEKFLILRSCENVYRCMLRHSRTEFPGFFDLAESLRYLLWIWFTLFIEAVICERVWYCVIVPMNISVPWIHSVFVFSWMCAGTDCFFWN